MHVLEEAQALCETGWNVELVGDDNESGCAGALRYVCCPLAMVVDNRITQSPTLQQVNNSFVAHVLFVVCRRILNFMSCVHCAVRQRHMLW